MFSDNSFFNVSSVNVPNLIAVCNSLKNGPDNSPWKPFFSYNNSEKKTSYSDTHACNIYNILETTRNESVCHVFEGHDSQNNLRPSLTSSMEILEDCEEITDKLDEEVVAQILKLKETLGSIQEGYPIEQICHDLVLFSSISPHQVPLICGILEVSLMNEIAVAVILNSLSSLEPTVSLITAASIIHHIVYSRVKELTSSASRIMTMGILKFAEKYPKAIVDELIVPCLNDASFGIPQVDLLQKIIKSSLPDDQVLYCCREALKFLEPEESTFCTLQCLVERKVPGDTILHQIFVEKMYDWSKLHSNSMKFSKLLLSLISVYGSQMTEEQKIILYNVAGNIQTFLKKVIESLIKKIA